MLYSGSGTPAAAVRLQQAVSDATISSPSISSEKDCIKFNFFSFSVRGKTLHSVKTFSSFLQIWDMKMEACWAESVPTRTVNIFSVEFEVYHNF